MRLSFQDPATNLTESIIDLHHGIMFYMIIVLTLVFWMLISIFFDFGYNRYKTSSNLLEDVLESRSIVKLTKNIVHGEVIEIIWTLTPAGVLVLIGIPSFALLYAIDELIDPALTLKVIGHQWYWSYEYTDILNNNNVDVENFKGINFDSYMLSEGDLSYGRLRLLEVDRKVWLPIETHIRVIVTANDVLHSWAVPAFGIKMDGIPGRLNQIGLFINRPGLFYGQCSEICGVNHGFMPICIKAVEADLFNFWCDFQLGLFDVKEEVVINNNESNLIVQEEVVQPVVQEVVQPVIQEVVQPVVTPEVVQPVLVQEVVQPVVVQEQIEVQVKEQPVVNVIEQVKVEEIKTGNENENIKVVKTREEIIQELKAELLKNEIELMKEKLEKDLQPLIKEINEKK